MKLLNGDFFVAALTALFLMTLGAVAQEQGNIKVTLLGTGGPVMFPDRSGISTLVEANGQRLLFDVGRDTAQSLYESRINPNVIDNIFLTHLHNDHYEGLPTLWMTPWFMLGRRHGFEMWGPQGTAEMIQGMRTMFDHDLKNRASISGIENLGILVHPPKLGVIYEKDGVTVTAFKVKHPTTSSARGYRVDYNARSVLLSGDTDFDENLVKNAMSVNLIIHNVIAFKNPGSRFVLSLLTTPEQAAEVFKRSMPKLAVYSHIVTRGVPADEISDFLLNRTRAAGYIGPLIVGKDHMVIDVTDEVTVHAPLVMALSEENGLSFHFPPRKFGG